MMLMREKELDYLTEKLEVCSLLPAALISNRSAVNKCQKGPLSCSVNSFLMYNSCKC